jgi:hypothetical protein
MTAGKVSAQRCKPQGGGNSLTKKFHPCETCPYRKTCVAECSLLLHELPPTINPRPHGDDLDRIPHQKIVKNPATPPTVEIILREFFSNNKNITQTADFAGVSHQYASRVIKKYRVLLQKYIAKVVASGTKGRG